MSRGFAMETWLSQLGVYGAMTVRRVFFFFNIYEYIDVRCFDSDLGTCAENEDVGWYLLADFCNVGFFDFLRIFENRRSLSFAEKVKNRMFRNL